MFKIFKSITEKVTIVFIVLIGIIFSFCDNSTAMTLNGKQINQTSVLNEDSESYYKNRMEIKNVFMADNLTSSRSSESKFDAVAHTIVPKSDVTFFEAFPGVNSIATNLSSFNPDLSEIIAVKEFQVRNLKVINVIEDCGIIWLEWTMYSNESAFELRYHPDSAFLQNYFNISMTDFDVINESSVNSVHSILITLPKEVIYTIQQQSEPAIYFAMKVIISGGNWSLISNLVTVYFTKAVNFTRSRYLEMVLVSIVLTSVILAVIVSVIAFVFAKLNKTRRKSSFDFQKSEYYYETVTDMSA